jgi:hypothetical protein
MRITRHPQAFGQGLWCLGHTLWIGSSFMVLTSALLMAHHVFACWHGDFRLRRQYGSVSLGSWFSIWLGVGAWYPMCGNPFTSLRVWCLCQKENPEVDQAMYVVDALSMVLGNGCMRTHLACLGSRLQQELHLVKQFRRPLSSCTCLVHMAYR